MKSDDGRLMLNTKGYWCSCKVSLLLKFKYGFKREGKNIGVGSPFETYYRNFIKGDLKIDSVWEGLAGYFWSAENQKTDKFLKDFYNKHCLGSQSL